MFSYFKDKINEQIENADKKINGPDNAIFTNQMNQHELILYEQMEASIEVGNQLSENIRQKIYGYLNSGEVCHDSVFPVAVRQLIALNLLTKDREKVSRALSMLEELVANCGQTMNETFNNTQFCNTLLGLALYKKYISLNYGEWEIIRQRAAGVFLFWHKKYINEGEHFIFLDYMIKVRDAKGDIPMQPFFREVKQKKQKQTQSKEKSEQIMTDLDSLIIGSETLADQAESYLKNHPQKIDTQYVRALKLKNKHLYNAAVEKSKDLDEQTKTRLNAAYKKVRGVLKKIEQWNDKNNREKAIKQEQRYLEQKVLQMSGTKTENKTSSQTKKQVNLFDEKIEEKCITPEKAQQNVSLLDDEEVYSTPKKLPTPVKIETPTKPHHYNEEQDLLDSSPSNSNAQIRNLASEASDLLNESPQQTQNTGSISGVVAVTASGDSQNLLDSIEQNSIGQTLNFTELYKQSSAPLQLQSIDFSKSPQKKQSLQEKASKNFQGSPQNYSSQNIELNDLIP